jgi:hypothetical protein
MKGLGWKFARDVVMTGIASLLIIVAPMSWVTSTVVSALRIVCQSRVLLIAPLAAHPFLIGCLGQATGIAFLIAGDSGIQYLEARMRHECGCFVQSVPLRC